MPFIIIPTGQRCPFWNAPKALAVAISPVFAHAIDWVLTVQQADAAKETTEEGKKRAHRRYADAVVALSKAFALAAASDAAQGIRDEVGFFQAIRAALIKSVPGDGKKSLCFDGGNVAQR